jgi:uracil-DNA glycosylase
VSARVDEALAALRTFGSGLAGRDLEAYHAAGLAPDEPVFGLGPSDAAFAVLGRDPGRDELRHRTGFIGASGRKLRDPLAARWLGVDRPTLADRLRVGERVFWLNTVPFKPIGNKAWPEAVRAACTPWVRAVLLHGCDAVNVLAFGQQAVQWFGEDATAHLAQGEGAWGRPFEHVLTDATRTRRVQVWAMPHPSPLNVRWARAFPDLYQAVLDAVLAGPAADDV